MKKFLSFLLAFVLMFSAFLPLQASAAECDEMNQAQLVALAKQVFPEYAEKIDGNRSSRSSEPQMATAEIYPVVQETRAVDDNTSMTYIELNNGVVTLGVARFDKNATITNVDSVTHTTYEEFTATIRAWVTEGPTFTATNVKYRLYPSSYDKITSAGNYGIPGYTSNKFQVSMNGTETASNAAYVVYSFPCPVGGAEYSGEVVFRVRNNSAYVEFNIW